MNALLAVAVFANLADLATFMRVNPALIPANETSPLPHMFGQTAGGLLAKLIMLAVVVVTVAVFRKRPRTEAMLLVIYTGLAVVGVASNTAFG